MSLIVSFEFYLLQGKEFIFVFVKFSRDTYQNKITSTLSFKINLMEYFDTLRNTCPHYLKVLLLGTHKFIYYKLYFVVLN